MRGRRSRNIKDPWLQMMQVRSENPALMKWLHRWRVQQELLMSNHHQRDHITRVVESEEQRVRDDAKAISRYRHIAGMMTKLDICWPPMDEVTVTMESNYDPYDEDTEDEEERENRREARRIRTPPPPYCGRRSPSRDRNDRRGGDGGGQRV